MYILIVTNSIDFTVDSIIQKFNNKVQFFRFNTDKFQDYEVKITHEKTVIINKITGISVDINACHSLYYRKITLPNLSGFDLKYVNLMQKEMLTVIEGIGETFGRLALTRPSILKRADNKIVQMQVARELGFVTPNSLLTNSNIEAERFIQGQNESIVKPISVGRINTDQSVSFIQTNLVENTESIEGLDLSPAYFQAYIHKEYEVRLTIVYDECFGVKIDSSNKVDWRKNDAKVKYSKINVPNDIKVKCFHMMKKLNLNFAAFDFIFNESGYTFLELNANGQWHWLDEELNLGISDKIVKYLMGE